MKKISHVYLHILCVPAQFHENTNIFVDCAKRQKRCREKAYFSIEFYHFYIGHVKNLFFSQKTHFVGT
jgi:hypothetical protein